MNNKNKSITIINRIITKITKMNIKISMIIKSTLVMNNMTIIKTITMDSNIIIAINKVGQNNIMNNKNKSTIMINQIITKMMKMNIKTDRNKMRNNNKITYRFLGKKQYNLFRMPSQILNLNDYKYFGLTIYKISLYYSLSCHKFIVILLVSYIYFIKNRPNKFFKNNENITNKLNKLKFTNYMFFILSDINFLNLFISFNKNSYTNQ
jgi:hypothetical protein